MPRFSQLLPTSSEPEGTFPLTDSDAVPKEPETTSAAERIRKRWFFRGPVNEATKSQAGPVLPSLEAANNSASAIHWLAFAAGAILLLVKAANLSELAYAITGANLKILYFVAPLAYIGVIFSQGLGSAVRNKPVIFFMLFYGWMVLSTPFSTWVGGSVGRIQDFTIHCLPLLFVTASLALTWKQVRMAFYTLAMAGVITLVSIRFFGQEAQGRMQLSSSGTIGNSNDLAAHLMLLLPFVVFVALDVRRSWAVRAVAIPMLGYGLFAVLNTGSRGALIALVAVTLFLLWKASAQIRIGFILAGLLLGAVLPTVLPDQTKARLGSLFGSEHGEAEESRDSREYLFFKSVEYSFQYPLFGVGPDQFPNYEGAEARSEGRHGNWHVTHCVWTQVSSECGIPALLFLIASISTAFFPLNRIYRLAREKQMEDFARASLCFLLSAVGFLVAITFLAQAYAYYIPVMVGLAVAFRNAAEKELGISLT